MGYSVFGPKPCNCPDLYIKTSEDPCKCTPGPALRQAILRPLDVPGEPAEPDFFGVPYWVVGSMALAMGTGALLIGLGTGGKRGR